MLPDFPTTCSEDSGPKFICGASYLPAPFNMKDYFLPCILGNRLCCVLISCWSLQRQQAPSTVDQWCVSLTKVYQMLPPWQEKWEMKNVAYLGFIVFWWTRGKYDPVAVSWEADGLRELEKLWKWIWGFGLEAGCVLHGEFHYWVLGIWLWSWTREEVVLSSAKGDIHRQGEISSRGLFDWSQTRKGLDDHLKHSCLYYVLEMNHTPCAWESGRSSQAVCETPMDRGSAELPGRVSSPCMCRGICAVLFQRGIPLFFQQNLSEVVWLLLSSSGSCTVTWRSWNRP